MNPHYQTLHPQYAAWSGRFFRNFFALAIPFIGLLCIADFLWLEYGGVFGDIAGVVNLLFIAFALYEWSWVRRRGLRRFILEWKDQHEPIHFSP